MNIIHTISTVSVIQKGTVVQLLYIPIRSVTVSVIPKGTVVILLYIQSALLVLYTKLE